MCWQLWSFQRSHARTQASLTVPWRYLRNGPNTARLAQSPDLRILLRTVWPEILTFVKPCVLRAVYSAVIIRLERWKRRRCLSWHCYVTHSLPLRGLSFVLPVCRRRIISREMVILDTLKQSGLHGLVSHSSLNHTRRLLMVILTEPWHRRSCELVTMLHTK